MNGTVFTTLKSAIDPDTGLVEVRKAGKPQIQRIVGVIQPATGDPWAEVADLVVKTHTGDIWCVRKLHSEIADYEAIH